MLEPRWRWDRGLRAQLFVQLLGGDRMRSWPDLVGFVLFQLCRLPRVDLDAGLLWLEVMVVTGVERAWKAWCSG